MGRGSIATFATNYVVVYFGWVGDISNVIKAYFVVALLYRLLFIYCQQRPSEDLPAKCLWAMEWPVTRLLGLSFAFTGNFVGCYNRLKECLICFKRSSQEVLTQSILGALSVDENLTQSCEVTRKELDLLSKLYKRTLWFWLASAALIIIVVH